LQIHRSSDVLILCPQDAELGADVAEAFRADAFLRIPPEGAKVALDLSSVNFMDSSGLSALVALMKRCRPGGGLVLFGVRPAVLELLALTRLNSVFPLCASATEAVAWFGSLDRGALRKTA
jgi:anti-sigma B factor antagonist